MDDKTCSILKILLQQSDYITLKEIQALLEEEYDIYCNEKTIKSAMVHINNFFESFFDISEAIETVKKKGSKISTNILNRGEMRFLHDALTYNTSITSNEGIHLYQKLSSLMPVHSIIEDKMDNNSKKMTLIYLNTILNAIENKNTIRFKYINYYYDHDGKLIEVAQSSNKEEYHIVSPYNVHMANGRYYLVAFSSNHPDNLTYYRIDRMRNVTSYNKSTYVDKLDEWDIDSQVKGAVNMFSSSKEIKLELSCHQKTLRTVVDQFGENISIYPSNQKDYLHITIEDVYESDGLIGWIMMMTPQIQVLQPTSLKQAILERLNKAIEMYK